jgi:hypothetical protein
MNAFSKVLLMSACGLLLSACMPTVRSYVDPQYRHATYDSLQRSESPIPVKVVTRFEQNGVPAPAADAALRRNVEDTLRASSLFVPDGSGRSSGEMSVVANNLADVGAARAKGFKTGLTFGASGSTVTDNYVFDISYKENDVSKCHGTYNHRLITTIGDATSMIGAMPTTLEGGFRQIVQDVMLNFLQVWQEKCKVEK